MANQEKIDPSRTVLIRRQFTADFRRRLRRLARAVTKFIDTDDSFGLKGPTSVASLLSEGGGTMVDVTTMRNITWRTVRPINATGKYRFLTDAQKLDQFKQWITTQVEAGFLRPIGGIEGQPWTARYVESAYQKGLLRAYTDTHAEELADTPEFYRGSREQFLRSAFNTPVAVQKLEMLQTRAFEAMSGLTDTMKSQLNYYLAQGLSRGESPLRIARTMRRHIAGLSRVRAFRIARTEIVRAQAEGQLDAFEMLQVKRVGALVEWSTAGDALVCPDCDEMEGQTFTIEEARGLIPLHPNCRCAWAPVVEV